MPLYEYQCLQCQQKFERLQKVTDDPLTTCPACGGKVQRIVSRTSFSLKGGGWYKDGYAGTKPSSPTPAAPTKTEDKKPTPPTTSDTKKGS